MMIAACTAWYLAYNLILAGAPVGSTGASYLRHGPFRSRDACENFIKGMTIANSKPVASGQFNRFTVLTPCEEREFAYQGEP